jgi:hypothetical protein
VVGNRRGCSFEQLGFAIGEEEEGGKVVVSPLGELEELRTVLLESSGSVLRRPLATSDSTRSEREMKPWAEGGRAGKGMRG